MRTRKEFFIGDLVESIQFGTRGIIEYSYSDAYGGRNHSEFSILWLDNKGNPESSSAWNYKRNLKCIDTTHRRENLQKIINYNGGAAPIAMNKTLAKLLGYTSIHTYESAINNCVEGEIKI